MRLRCLSATDIEALLSMPAAIEATRSAFVALSTGRADAPQRQALEVAEHDATTLLMGGYVPGEGLAAKIVSVFPGNAVEGRPVIHGVVAVLDESTGEPKAVIDGTALTALRTGAAAGLATELLARREAAEAALLGCGAQAPAQLLALDAVRELEIVRLHNRTLRKAHELAERMAGRTKARLEVVTSVADAVRPADIVTCVTSSSEPLFEGALLAPGAHVNAMGSFRLDMSELDLKAVDRCRVFVDSVEAALAEAGELVAAEAAGVTSRLDWTEIGRVASGDSPGRRSESEVTLFKSVGQAVQDAVAAGRVVRAAEAENRGTLIEL